jgi:hypothetical protein
VSTRRSRSTSSPGRFPTATSTAEAGFLPFRGDLYTRPAWPGPVPATRPP